MTLRTWHLFAAACVSGLALTACTSTNPSLPNEGKSVASDPISRARVHTELAALYYQQGSMKTALDELGESGPADNNFQKAVALAPNDPDIRNNYGLFLCDTGQYQKGLTQLDVALANPLYNTPVRALDNAARCAQSMGDAALANRYRQQAARYGTAVETPSSKLQ